MSAIETKTFKSGNSVAVRLPKELGFAADMAVIVERVGDRLEIKAKADPAKEKQEVIDLVSALRALGPPIVSDEPERIAFPDRPGL